MWLKPNTVRKYFLQLLPYYPSPPKERNPLHRIYLEKFWFFSFLMTSYWVEQSAAPKSQFFCPSTVYLWPESMLWDTGQLVPWRDTENSGGVPPVQWACSVQGILWHHGEWLVIKTSLNCTSYYKLRFSQSKLIAPPGAWAVNNSPPEIFVLGHPF